MSLLPVNVQHACVRQVCTVCTYVCMYVSTKSLMLGRDARTEEVKRLAMLKPGASTESGGVSRFPSGLARSPRVGVSKKQTSPCGVRAGISWNSLGALRGLPLPRVPHVHILGCRCSFNA